MQALWAAQDREQEREVVALLCCLIHIKFQEVEAEGTSETTQGVVTFPHRTIPFPHIHTIHSDVSLLN